MYFKQRQKRVSSLGVYGTKKGRMQTEQKSICVTEVLLKATRHNVQSRVILHGTPSQRFAGVCFLPLSQNIHQQVFAGGTPENINTAGKYKFYRYLDA
jgi:hypothetical protein